MSDIKIKRELMVVSHKLIPLMESEELKTLALVLDSVIERLVKEGRVADE